MKKSTKLILISLGTLMILIGIILIIGVIFYSVLTTQSILSKASYVNVNDGGDKVWDLSGADPNKNPVAGIQSTDGKFNFIINKWGGSTKGDAKRSFELSKAKEVSQILQDFLNTHTQGTFDSPDSNTYGFYIPYDSGWDTKLGLTTKQYFSSFGWNLPYSAISNILDNSFMIFEGYYLTDCNTQVNVRTYGMCKFASSCYLYDPAPEVEGAWGDCGMGVLIPTSWKLYFKEGGYTEEEGKIKFGFTNMTYYRFEDNTCREIKIILSEKSPNDYETLAECQVKILDTEIDTSGYNLINNKCEPVSSVAQYKTLSECQSKIIVGPKGYVLENGICKYTELNPTFNTQSECEQSLIVAEDNFWNQKTLGIKNSILIISLVSLVVLFIIVFVILILVNRRK